MCEIYLHIGLHKTGTKFFQHKIFPNLDVNKFIYNPPVLTQYLMDYLKANNEDKDQCLQFLREEYRKFNNDNRAILISREIMSGNLFSAYRLWPIRIKNIKSCFPEAKVIITLRNQIDWLVSCYRESVHEHHYQTISEFLSTDSAIETSQNTINKNGLVCLDPYILDYSKMIQVLFDQFGKHNVKILFFENFKKNKQSFTNSLLEYIGAETFQIVKEKKIPNRGYSALAIYISILRYKLFSFLRLKKFFIHRPIFFFGEKSIPAGLECISILDKEKYWGSQFYRDNEEVRSSTYTNMTRLERVKVFFTWRYFMKKIFDRFIYIDWNFDDDRVSNLKREYSILNKKLINLIPEIDVPLEYRFKSQ